MKLKKCYVSSFGKLKNYTYNFDDGINTIKEENGWGKSTLATFIKSVFYGLNDCKRNVTDNERLHYKPWNSTEKFGGYIEFEWGGRLFKIERFFGNKESEDVLKLFDLNTGKEFSNTSDIGKRIFEIDEEGFLSTTFFSQKDFQVKSNTSITTKYNQTCEMHDSESFDKALAKIEEKAKTYKYRGDKGLLSDIKREIYDTDEKIESAKKTITVADNMRISAEQLEKEITELENKIKVIAENEKMVAKEESINVKKEQFDRLNKEKATLEQNLEPIKRALNGKNVSLSEIETCLGYNNELEKTRVKLNAIREDIGELEKLNNIREDIVKTDKISIAKTNDKKGAERKQKPYLYAIGGVPIIVGIVLAFVVGLVPAIICSVLGVACLVACGVYNVSMTKKSAKTVYDSSYYTQMIDIRKTEILEKKKIEYNQYKEIERVYIDKIDGFIKSFNLVDYFDRYRALMDLSKIVNEYNASMDRLFKIQSELENYANENFEQVKSSGLTLSELHIEKQKVQQILTEKMQQCAQKKANVRYYEDIIASISDLESTKIDLIEKEKQYKEDYELLKLTAEFLKKADESLKVKYRAPLQDSLNKYLSYISGDKYKSKIDIDLSVTIEEDCGEKVSEFYSKGNQNLFEICKRFALTDVLFKTEKPFIILDDPFYNLDDEKVKASISLIKKLSEEYQIIYFVCHESRRA